MSMVEDNEAGSYERRRKGFLPFGLVFALLAFLAYSVTQPLLRPIAWSVLLTFFVRPFYVFLYERFFRGRCKGVAAAITTVLVIVVIVVPVVIIGLLLVREGINVISALPGVVTKLGEIDLSFVLDHLPPQVAEAVRPYLVDLSYLNDMLLRTARWVATWMASTSRDVMGNVFRLFYQLFALTIVSFYILRDGHLILKYVDDILPLPKNEREAIFERGRAMLSAVLYGVTLTAGIQATLGGLGWWYVGLPSPLLFGGVMFVTAMIPFIGTPMVLLPGALYLFLVGQWSQAIMLAAWSLLVVSTVDNFIRPYFISEGSKVHMLVAFIGGVGGLAAWGFLGLFLGPLIVTLFVFFLDSYRRVWHVMRGA